jgi:hypothetical protein
MNQLCDHRVPAVPRIRALSDIREIDPQLGVLTASAIEFRKSRATMDIGRHGTERLTGKIVHCLAIRSKSADNFLGNHRQGYRSMHLLFRFSLIAVLGIFPTLLTAELRAQEPGWTSRVLKLGPEREISEQTPILERPYRPLHFYGNAARRNYYRGNPLPTPRDILITGAFLAPSSRERDAEREQRLGGFDYRLVAEDDSEKKEEKDNAESKQPEPEPVPPQEPQTEGSDDSSSSTSATPSSETNRASQSSRRPALDAQARRNRRGN